MMNTLFDWTRMKLFLLISSATFAFLSLVILSTCYKCSMGKWTFSVNSMENQITCGLARPQRYGYGATIELSQLVALL